MVGINIREGKGWGSVRLEIKKNKIMHLAKMSQRNRFERVAPEQQIWVPHVSPWARTSILLPTQRVMHRALHKPKLPESRAVILGTGDTHLVPPEPHKPPPHPKIPPQIHPHQPKPTSTSPAQQWLRGQNRQFHLFSPVSPGRKGRKFNK